jgi:hypothetical protein
MESSGSYKEVYWEDVREDVRKVNPELAKIIDRINPDKHYPLIKASYRFGDLIVKDGIPQLPAKNGELVPLMDASVRKNVKDQLSYSSIPLFLTLKNANEVFINSSGRTIPLNMFYPGSLLGLFESLDYMFGRVSTPKWCVSSGARNLFMLPKINEISGFNRLKIAYELDLKIQPRYLIDHWKMFHAIASHKNFDQPWHSEVIFFTKGWFTHQKDWAWYALKDYLCRHAWTQAQFAISKVGLNLSWEHFVDAISSRNLRPTPYIADQVKHIMLIAAGRSVGFKSADDSNQVAPVFGLQKAIVEIYQLKKYYPTIMHISSIEKESTLPIYYSLSYPTLLEGSPQNKTPGSTIMLDLREIKQLIDTIRPVFQDHDKVDGNVFDNVKFNYFHVEKDKYGEILQSDSVLNLNDKLLGGKKFKDREFCETSQFWRGCIMITR